MIGDDKHTHTRWIPGEDDRIINDATPSVLFESCQSCDLLNRAVYTVRRFARFEGWLASERKRFSGGDEGRIWAESPECKWEERCLHITPHLWGWSWMYCIGKEKVEREHPPTHVHSGELHQRERVCVCVYCCYLGSFVVCLCGGIHCSWLPPFLPSPVGENRQGKQYTSVLLGLSHTRAHTHTEDPLTQARCLLEQSWRWKVILFIFRSKYFALVER